MFMSIKPPCFSMGHYWHLDVVVLYHIGLLHVYRTWSIYLWPSRFQQHTQSLITMETKKQMYSCISHVPYREPDLKKEKKAQTKIFLLDLRKNINRDIQRWRFQVFQELYGSLPATSHIHFPSLPTSALHLRELQLPRSFVNCLPVGFIQ